MKKLIAFILAALFATISFAGTEMVDGVEYTYSISNGEATIGTGKELSAAIPSTTSGELVIPSTLGGCPVTTIGKFAFFECMSLTSVTIPESVTTIGKFAFYYCRSLTSLTIPASVTEIKGGAIAYNSSFLRIKIATENPSYCLLDGDLYTKDGRMLVACLGSKTSVSIPPTVTTIGDYAFDYCSSLASVTIPESVTTIGNYAFSGCSSLKSVSIPGSVAEIGEWAFDRTPFLDDQPLGMVILGSCLYSYKGECPASLIIPEGVKSISRDAFKDCRSLESITLPSSMTTIGSYVFYGCKSLTSIAIPEGVTTIGSHVFLQCDSLTSVTIPEGVTTIREFAFSFCYMLESMTIPEGATEIGPYAFQHCRSLKTVTIPSSMTTIGESAFYGCWSLKTVYVDYGDTERIKELMRGKGCNVDALTFVEAAYKLVIDENGCLTGYEGELPSEIVIPNGIKAIGPEAFKDSTTLTSIKLSNSVTSIGKRAFYGCENLETVILPTDKPNIGSQAFFGVPWYENAVVDYASGASQTVANSVTVTNVVVHYVVNSVQPEFAKPVSEDAGFVNVIAEVKGTSVAVPQTWAEEYPEFAAKFGSDFTKALTAKSGKTAAGGREMLVWEDYVAGTDPTDPESKFTATMTMVDGKPVVSWTPELDADRAAMRKYTTYGKAKLSDSEWTVVEEGHEDDYNFFKVTVEMR